ncbi:hypothetical protein [Polycyclovorans algicola]|uniref:hypothetical protein n=1 Tax=Polycyclovorans algicola TaxID=616992 RepID=UPI0004A776A7|nr:hypothetical protein [Polycyclovorans algicola]
MIRFLLLVVVLALAWTGWLHHRATQAVAQQVTALRPYALLRHQTLRAWPGQPVTLQGVTLEPVGGWRDGLGLPVGYRLSAQRLYLGDADAATGERRIVMDGLQIPVDGLPATLDQMLRRAGITQLDGALTIQARPPLDGLPWQWGLDWQVLDGLAVELTARFHAGPEFPAFTLAGMTLVDATLAVYDSGVLSRLQQGAALAARRPVDTWADTTLEQLQAMAGDSGWALPTELTPTLHTLMRVPQSFIVAVEPPAPVRLDPINLYAPGDRWALLGVSAGLSPQPDASR